MMAVLGINVRLVYGERKVFLLAFWRVLASTRDSALTSGVMVRLKQRLTVFVGRKGNGNASSGTGAGVVDFRGQGCGQDL